MQPKNRLTAAILAFFTGFIGGHKLYLGSIGGFIGFNILFIVSIIFSLGVPISLIIGLIQGIKLLNMSDADFDRKYNRGSLFVRKGPLEARREAQMKQYEQFPDIRKKTTSIRKSNPLSSVKTNPFKISGIKKYKDFDLEDAISDFKKGIQISPNDVALHFNIACAYSLTEKKEKAFQHLIKAVSYGLKDVERILSHDDLAFVRIQPEFDHFRANGFRENPYGVVIEEKEPKGSEKSEHFEQDDRMDDGLLVQLKKLSDLRSKGVLSEAEFTFERKKLLRQ
jgi:TM2 domain-containing membrane protein YozV